MIFPYEIRKIRNVEEKLRKYVEGSQTGKYADIINVYGVYNRNPRQSVREHQERYPHRHVGMVLVGPRNFCLPEKYTDEAKQYLGFEVRPNDVWILGYVESGTLMAQKLALLLCNEINEQDVERSHLQYCDGKLLEESLLNGRSSIPNYVLLGEHKGRRFIRTHLPISLLPHDLLDVGCKVIYLARNPKDVAASIYSFSNNFPCRYDEMTFENFLKMHTRGLSWFGPQLNHVKEAWQLRNRDDFLFIFYEDLIKDTRRAIRQFADFLNVELVDKEVSAVAEYMTIDGLRSQKNILRNNHLSSYLPSPTKKMNSFGNIRRNNLWNHVNEDTMKQFDNWIASSLRNTELCFPQ